MSELDRTDIALLRHLRKDARLANKELAAAVGIAPSTCHERLKRLWSTGVVTGAHAALDERALGFQLEALLMIELAKHERGTVDSILEEIAEIPEVKAVFLITGRYDLVVHVVARDMGHLKDLALDQFTSRPVVTRIETSIVYEARARHHLPLAEARPSALGG